jgi:hypothetical protein
MCSSSSERPLGTYRLQMRMPPQVAAMARASCAGSLPALPNIGWSRKVRSTLSKPDAGSDGNTVPLVHAEVRNFVTHALKELPREVLVLALGLLDGQDIAVAALKPGFNAVGTGTEGVHIPGSYLHSH